MAYEPTMEDIIGILEQTEEGRRLIAKLSPPAPAVASGSMPPIMDYDDGTGGRRVNSPAATYMTEIAAEREAPEQLDADVLSSNNNIPHLISAPAGSHKRRPTTDEKIAAGDPYPDGFWRRMFPKAEIEYTYPGDDNYFEDRDQNGMLEQLLRNRR